VSNNNLYNILANFNKLTPAEKPVDTTPKEKIYESVEARGSVAEGLSKIEARLAETFAKEGMATRDSQGPEAVAYQAGYQDGKRHTGGAVVPKGFGAHTDQYVRGFNDAKNLPAEGVAEAKEECPDCECTPCECSVNEDDGPGAKWRRGYHASGHPAGYKHKSGEIGPLGGTYTDEISGYDGETSKVPVQKYRDERDTLAGRKSVQQFDRTQAGTPYKNPQVAVDKFKNQIRSGMKRHHGPVGVLPEDNMMESAMSEIGAELRDIYDRDDVNAFYKLFSANTPTGQFIQNMANDVVEGLGLHPKDDFEEIEQIVWSEIEDMFRNNNVLNDMNESTCMECGMRESACGCKHDMNEDYKHKGKAYGGAAQKDDEDEEDDKPKEKKGVGRPKNEPKVGSNKEANDTVQSFIGKKPKAEVKGKKYGFTAKEKAEKKKGKKVGESHSKLEARFRELLGESVLTDSTGSTLDHIANKYKRDIKDFEATGNLSTELFDTLYDYYQDDMPYGVQKARSGDPHDWIADRITQDLGLQSTSLSPWEQFKSRNDAARVKSGMEPTDWSKHPNFDEAAPAVPGRPDHGGIPGNVPIKDKLAPQKNWEMPMTQDEGVENSMESELDELAKLAGLKIADEGNAFTGKLANTPKGEKFELDGKTYKDTSTLDEGTCPTCDCKPCACNEGNAFGKAVSDAKADGIQPGEKVKVGGHEYPVRESTTLEDIAKLSGIAVEGRDYGDASFNEPAHFDNSPEPEVMDADVMLKGGDGEVAGKQKAMHPNKPTFKNGDNPLSKPTKGVDESADPLESLGRRLLKAYESIKIQK
jgi:hypothetical protein